MEEDNISQVEKKIKKDKRKVLGGILNALLVLIFLMLVGNFIFEWNYSYSDVIGTSMQNTLNANFIETDESTYDCVVYADDKELSKGDIIIAVSPTNTDKYVIKRVIATAGDTLEIKKEFNQTTSSYDYSTYVNGQKIDESYIKNSQDMFETYNKFYNFFDGLKVKFPQLFTGNVLTVGENQVFYMGDNRGNTSDCSTNGPQSMLTVVGKVEYVKKSGQQISDISWFFTKVYGGYKYLFNKIF